MSHVVTAAIAVRVDSGTYEDAVKLVEEATEGQFDGALGASLVSFCNHTDPDVLFHEDGPCPPLDLGDE